MDRIRTCRFGGSKKPQDALLFLEDMQHNADCYGIDHDILPGVISELLKDKAWEWYKNNREQWRTWETFKTSFNLFFIPKRLRTQLEDEVQRHYQGNRPIQDYVISIQSLIRFIPELSLALQLEWIYQNLNPEYKSYTHPRDFTTIPELIAMCEEFEQIQSEAKRAAKARNHRKIAATTSYESAEDSGYDRKTCCWNCGDRAHQMKDCPEPKRLVCSASAGKMVCLQ